MASIRNIVVVAIMQVAVIVAGVLAAGVCHRLFASQNMPLPMGVTLLYANGVLGFLIPLAWSILTVVLQLRADVSDDLRALMFWFGVFVLLVLVVLCLFVDVPPWLQVMFAGNHLGDDDGN
jgi:hypothetical protein